MSDWSDNIVPAAARLFAELRQEFTQQQIKHLLVALERCLSLVHRANLMKDWRAANKMGVEDAARELGISVEDVEAIEDESLRVNAAAMRPIRRALQRCKKDLAQVDAVSRH